MEEIDGAPKLAAGPEHRVFAAAMQPKEYLGEDFDIEACTFAGNRQSMSARFIQGMNHSAVWQSRQSAKIVLEARICAIVE